MAVTAAGPAVAEETELPSHQGLRSRDGSCSKALTVEV